MASSSYFERRQQGQYYNQHGDEMDAIMAVRQYVDRIVQGDEKCRNKMKILLLDDATTQIVSSVYSQTEILNEQVYLVSKLSDVLGGEEGGGNKGKDKKDMMNGDGGDGGKGRGAANDGRNSHLKAVVFCRPTQQNVELLSRELRSVSDPKFHEYHVFFSGILTTGLLRILAESDLHERVQQVQEFYADYVPINEDLVTLNCHCDPDLPQSSSIGMTVAAGTSWAPKYAAQYERNIQGIQSLLLSLKRQPSCIRYTASSPCTEEIANDIHDAIQSDDIFHFRKRKGHRGSASASGETSNGAVGGGSGRGVGGRNKGTSNMNSSNGGGGHGGAGGAPGFGSGLLLLVLDRRDDPITPLLSQWTYQAMVHELLGLNNHRVILRNVPNVSKDLEEVVLSSIQDDFFYNHRYKNFGELGDAVQALLKEYQKKSQQHSVENLSTITDIQNFMDRFPELRTQSHHVSKHVVIMSELARLVEQCNQMDVSQLEQELACSDDHNVHWRDVMEKLSSDGIKIPDKLRLGLLYALRYETSGNIHMLQNAMQKGGVSNDRIELMNILLRYAGTKSRSPGLYGDYHDGSNPLNNNIVSKMTKSFISSVQGVENVYAQHVPLLMDTVQAIMKGKLSTKTHPVVSAASRRTGGGGGRGNDFGGGGGGGTGGATMIPDEIIVYMVGGVTYEEATKIAEYNSSMNGKVRIVLAGSTIHNSNSFLEELKATNM